ncbi:hypothetical protein [Algoriphagus sediminis]|uniref:Uncharacterized protein n=1 Tax=Algoriphagus sediminis TaxID=3057113 RepID=A0ABT7YB84_9BACT|nr:hypothetical protein [Algoriphagus sediminis]MDN3203776.1 hypothetical protein [Algoriphagus sediminis]
MKITLIFSRHKEHGACNVQALLKIIERVKPDVIFEELSEALYQEAYEEKTLNNLESMAIREYVSKYDVPHIPVDTYQKPPNYESIQNSIFDKLFYGAGYESFQLRSFLDQVQTVIGEYGFSYLNDDSNDMNMEKQASLIHAALEKLNDPKLKDKYHKDREVVLKREDVILDNVYTCCKGNDVKNGLMLIGSGHRRSILRKIEERAKTEFSKINWHYFSDIYS